MTQLELKDIETKLSVWRAERHLEVSEQRKGLLSNILEELTEYSRATTLDEEIDALCDICVFTMNSTDKNILLDESYAKEVFEIYFGKEGIAFAILCSLYNDIQAQILSICFLQMKRIGYNPYECMLETIKEISSRTGHWDDNIKKFVKDKSPEAQAKWYKADYDKCRYRLEAAE